MPYTKEGNRYYSSTFQVGRKPLQMMNKGHKKASLT
jgi:hypothetical protein